MPKIITKKILGVEGTVTIDEVEDALRVLLDIAEQCYPKYYQCGQIANILDLYKKLFG